MRTGVLETRRKRTWYGLTAQVTLGTRFLHWAGFDGLVIPHPPMANWLLRLGLSGRLSRNLIFAHEFAHFRTAPVLFVYMFVIIFLAYMKGRIGVWEMIILLVSVQAVWEILSEGLVLLEDSTTYRKSYKGIARLPRLLFWAGGGIFTAAGWLVLLYSKG